MFMSQEELIAQAEHLRQAYNQRRNLISGILKDIRGSYQAQRREQDRYARLKANYSQYLEIFPDEQPLEVAMVPDPPQATWLILEAPRARLSTNLKALDRVASALKTLNDSLRTKPPDVVKLAKAHEMLQKLQSSFPDLSMLAEQCASLLEQAYEDLSVTFGGTLRDAFAAEGLAVEGRPPKLDVGRFCIDLNFAKRQARILYGKEPVGKPLKLSVEGILRAYRAAHKAIMGRQVDGQKWLQRLYEAWQVVNFRNGRRAQDANLVACYIELALHSQEPAFLNKEPRKSLFKEYSRAQFAYDADRFINREQLKYGKLKPFMRSSSRQQTESSERSIWIVTGDKPSVGSYVSTLSFKEE